MAQRTPSSYDTLRCTFLYDNGEEFIGKVKDFMDDVKETIINKEISRQVSEDAVHHAITFFNQPIPVISDGGELKVSNLVTSDISSAADLRNEIAQLKEAVFNLQMAQKDNKELSKALRLEKSKNLKVRKNYRRLFTDVKRMEASHLLSIHALEKRVTKMHSFIQRNREAQRNESPAASQNTRDDDQMPQHFPAQRAGARVASQKSKASSKDKESTHLGIPKQAEQQTASKKLNESARANTPKQGNKFAPAADENSRPSPQRLSSKRATATIGSQLPIDTQADWKPAVANLSKEEDYGAVAKSLEIDIAGAPACLPIGEEKSTLAPRTASRVKEAGKHPHPQPLIGGSALAATKPLKVDLRLQRKCVLEDPYQVGALCIAVFTDDCLIVADHRDGFSSLKTFNYQGEYKGTLFRWKARITMTVLEAGRDFAVSNGPKIHLCSAIWNHWADSFQLGSELMIYEDEKFDIDTIAAVKTKALAAAVNTSILLMDTRGNVYRTIEMRAPAIDMCATTDDGLAIFDTDGVYKIHIASGNLVLTKVPLIKTVSSMEGYVHGYFFACDPQAKALYLLAPDCEKVHQMWSLATQLSAEDELQHVAIFGENRCVCLTKSRCLLVYTVDSKAIKP